VTEQPKPDVSKSEEKEQDKFKFEIIYLVPILASLIFAVFKPYPFLEIHRERQLETDFTLSY
jgi:hypothetical protein